MAVNYWYLALRVKKFSQMNSTFIAWTGSFMKKEFSFVLLYLFRLVWFAHDHNLLLRPNVITITVEVMATTLFKHCILTWHFLRPLIVETIPVHTSLSLSLCVNNIFSAGSPLGAYIAQPFVFCKWKRYSDWNVFKISWIVSDATAKRLSQAFNITYHRCSHESMY